MLTTPAAAIRYRQYSSRPNTCLVIAKLTNMTHTQQTAVHKPLCDKRTYQHAQLSSGVRILVVQGPDAVYAAACASVQAGYFDDPAHLPGAAHFLEHMVHLGSDKFPDEKEYKAFLAKHGGSSNASTSMVHTKYHFRIHSSALQGALQRFGAMLSCPLIPADAAAREVENVHAEYSRNTNSDGRKLLQLRRSLCEPPYSNFSTGSIKTLWEQPNQQGVDVPAALKSLWQSFYTADATCVAVVGPQDPEVLLQWVTEGFQDMPVNPSINSSTHSAHRAHTNGGASNSNGSSESYGIAGPCGGSQQLDHRYPTDVVASSERGVLARLCPQRDLRELELSWYIPQGMMMHSSTKPWSWASHLLGHEGAGSVAHLLKAQGLVQDLNVGTGDEVRLGRGWMFWRVQVSLTQAGEDALQHVVATIYRGIQLLQRCSDKDLRSTWCEAAKLAQLRFNWQDPTEPLPCAQSAAYALHYYEPEATLSGSHLMTEYNPAVLRWFANQLTPDNMVVYYSSHRNRSLVNSKEQWYGADYSVQQLPQDWLDCIAQYKAVDMVGSKPDAADSSATSTSMDTSTNTETSSTTTDRVHDHVAIHEQHQPPLQGELHLPEPNWAIPEDLSLRQDDADTDSSATHSAAVYDGAPTPPELLMESPGLCVWHKTDTSYGLPKVHLYLHIVTPITYSTPQTSIATRLLLRVLEDLLLPVTYPADLAGSWCDISGEQGGLSLKVVGFPGVAQKLMMMVLQGLMDLTFDQVQERFTTMSGRLIQNLTNWAKNNPAQHAEYGAHHLLQLHHHHNGQLLAAAQAAAPEQLLALQQQLAAGVDVHVDMLAYGNISKQEAVTLTQQLQQQLKPQGLPAGVWPPAGRVISLSPAAAAVDSAAVDDQASLTVADAGSATGGTAAAVADSKQTDGNRGSNVLATYLPDNPNPSNSNSAMYYTVQLGSDNVYMSVLLDLFVQMSAKAAFHELRTRQRLGYSVSLNSCSLHRQLGLMIRIQSPTSTPDVLVAAVRAWLAGFRAELQEMAQQHMDTAKQALRDKYLDPPKSLHEASKRTWSPISSRSLAFDRRKQKAALADQLGQQQLVEFYDTFLNPEGPLHRALCVLVWGGRQQVQHMDFSGSEQLQQGDTQSKSSNATQPPSDGTRDDLIVTAEAVESFKRSRPLMPIADLVFPPAAS